LHLHVLGQQLDVDEGGVRRAAAELGAETEDPVVHPPTVKVPERTDLPTPRPFVLRLYPTISNVCAPFSATVVHRDTVSLVSGSVVIADAAMTIPPREQGAGAEDGSNESKGSGAPGG